jgi:hypothetical protein
MPIEGCVTGYKCGRKKGDCGECLPQLMFADKKKKGIWREKIADAEYDANEGT